MSKLSIMSRASATLAFSIDRIKRTKGKIQMRTLVLATVAAMATTPALAQDLGVAGLSLDTELKAAHMIDAESTVVTINPELTWSGLTNLDLTLGTTLNVWETVGDTNIMDELDHLPVIELGAEYAINDRLNFYSEMNYDLELSERSDIEVGVSFNF
jgi:hypothetical protein